jgi:hypothetical protein
MGLRDDDARGEAANAATAVVRGLVNQHPMATRDARAEL